MQEETRNFLGELTNELGRIFRYVFPGFFILLVSFLSSNDLVDFFSLFGKQIEVSKLSGAQVLSLLFVLALVVGNFWYVVHRYIIHQLFEFIIYFIIKHDFHYVTWLQKHIFNVNKNGDQKWRKPILLRSAQVFFLAIVGESILFFSFIAKEHSFLKNHSCWAIAFGIVFLLTAFVQQYITTKIDMYGCSKFKSRTVSTRSGI